MFELTREEIIKVSPIVLTAIIALVGWIFTYLHKQHIDIKTNKLDRINKQLRELYGPLYARLLASHSTWEAFWKVYRPAHGGNSYFMSGAQVTEKEKEIWRNWMSNVFEPFNSETEKLILQNIDLLESDEIPKAFIDALSHIAAYKAVLADWKRSDFSNHVSVNNWPSRELLMIVEPEYKRLRTRQRELIGK
ncbi:hypothetical protein F3X87_07705 [Aeromonas caviae]|uniref:hypothetical protein n=1 Tax=Aeromonas caviae TaxID=648 RepID=UPI001244E0CC|nr:hypothetical protein [Aeromonas caviae]KAB0681579.1 hypothetical protein F3X87_07705 [Aeromonas caviae]